MKGYKAFEKGMICKGKQYAENTVFEEDEAKMCERGMHFCEDPLDVLDYYPLIDEQGNITEFAKVEALDEPLKDENKYCSKKLKIGAKLDFGKFVNIAVSYEIKKSKLNGNHSKLASSGNYSQLATSGNHSQLATSGDSSKLASSGYSSQLATSGDYSKLVSSGRNCVVMCAGYGCRAKAKIGSWITLAEWGHVDGEYIPTNVVTKKVDGIKIKEDTFYTLKNGRFTEVKE